MCFIGSGGRKKKRTVLKKAELFGNNNYCIINSLFGRKKNPGHAYVRWKNCYFMSYSTFGAIHATPSQPEETSYPSQSYRLCLYTLTPQSTLFNIIKNSGFVGFRPAALELRSSLGHGEELVVNMNTNPSPGHEDTARHWQRDLLANTAWPNNSTIKTTTAGKQTSDSVPEAARSWVYIQNVYCFSDRIIPSAGVPNHMHSPAEWKEVR